MMAAQTPTIVLVHGAWADATGFGAEIRALQRWGLRAVRFANPLRDLAGDAAYLAGFLRGLAGPVVLVGHSYGGQRHLRRRRRQRPGAGAGLLQRLDVR
jgi:pimeloyl-ACP methyl ester carboxylesterase